MARTKKRYCLETQGETTNQSYRTGIYIRLSKERTESWRNKSQSIDTQESLTRAFAKEHGLSVVKCYIDYEYSGTKFNRPAFQEMMEAVKNGTINCILIRDLSRLGRDYIEMGRLIDKVFPFLGVRFISINDHLDTHSGLEEVKSFEVEIKNLVNDLYSKDISKKVTSIHVQQAQKGYFIGSFAPYGYQLDKQREGTKLVIDPIVKPILNEVFQRLIHGESIIKVTTYLNDTKIAVPTIYRRTGKLYKDTGDTVEWRYSTLLRLVQNPVYQGKLVQRKTNKSLSEEDYIRFDCAHEAYIDEVEYDVMISSIRSRRSVRKTTRSKTSNRYRGLIYAKGKTTQMQRCCRHFSNKKSDYDYYYFTDYIYNSDKSDRQTVYISERDLDRVISKLIQAEMERLGTIHYLLPKLEAKKEKYISARQSKIKQYKQGLSRLQEGIRDLYTSYSLSEIDRETYLVYKSESEAKVETISQEITHCELAVGQIEEKYQKQVCWLKSLDKYSKDSFTAELLDALIERVEVDVDKRVTVTFLCQIGGVDDV